MKIRIALAFELIVLFVLLPILYWLNWVPIHKLIPLVMLFVYCSLFLFKYNRVQPERWALRGNWNMILWRFVIVAIVVFMTLMFLPGHAVVADFEGNKNLVIMMILYPFLSAFPQEVIFREFFFYRYRLLFKRDAVMYVSGVILFAFAHIYFTNWIVIAFTLVGGIIFSQTYLKTRSLLMVTIEHTLYGLLILASGLTDYFYKAF